MREKTGTVVAERRATGFPGRVERTPPVGRCALYSLFAPAFRSRECHTIAPCTVASLLLSEACLRENRLHGSEGGEGESPFRPLSISLMAHPGLCNIECDRSLC